jgi:protocatechuate 3,4-dioxygenase beta subunit
MTGQTRISTLLVFSLLLCFGASPARAQINLAAVEGTVTDPSGAVVPGAVVEALELDTGLPRSTTSNAVGAFRIPGLTPGNYSVTFRRPDANP